MTTMDNEFSALNDALTEHGRTLDAGNAEKVARAAAGLAGRFSDMMSATVEGTDPTGHVTATVKLSGRIESVYLSPHAIRNLPGSALDRACFDAIMAARSAGAAKFAAQVEDLTGQRIDLQQS